MQRPLSVGDSSDDDLLEPMKFSAEARALLGEEVSAIDDSSPAWKKEETVNAKSRREEQRQPWRSSPALVKRMEDQWKRPSSNTTAEGRVQRRVVRLSPSSTPSSKPKDNSVPRRVIRLSTSSISSSPDNSSLPRRVVRLSPRATPPPESASIHRAPLDDVASRSQLQGSFKTPAPQPRSVRIRTIPTSSTAGSGGSATQRETADCLAIEANNDNNVEAGTTALPQATGMQDNAPGIGAPNTGKLKYGEDSSVQGSLRVKRVGKVSGSYLSGPARRGTRRRQSEEDVSPVQEDMIDLSDGGNVSGEKQEALPEQHDSNRALVGQTNSRPATARGSPEPSYHVRFAASATGSPGRDKDVRKQPVSTSSLHSRTNSRSNMAALIPKEPATDVQPVFRVPPPPHLPSRHDQENEAPPTFKRDHLQGPTLLDRIDKVLQDGKMLAPTPGEVVPERKALAPRSDNIALRPVPPPPKMSMLETSTAPAGAAAASESKKKKIHISVNGKIFTRMDCIGRGGSSRVYQVMAENYKVFALKRVTLQDVDDVAKRGYKGEIELLRKLRDVDRVVRLFDWEINDEKQTLSVLMEKGEIDLNTLLNLRLGAADAVFDISFTRYYWKEMLECVRAVHMHNIVHSDLKPANFISVNGRLKLIDFGIANAIGDDTVNVHREQHIGTPNYMSPEALLDANAASGLPAKAGKMMLLGKPSDVWSLGCMLYQMVYGKPPFAHIPNQLHRIMAIANAEHVIEYPEFAIGGPCVPACLILTLRKCLNRDPTQRPTTEQLLEDHDPFLYPDREDVIQVSQDTLWRIMRYTVERCKLEGLPDDPKLGEWRGYIFDTVKRAVDAGKA